MPKSKISEKPAEVGSKLTSASRLLLLVSRLALSELRSVTSQKSEELRNHRRENLKSNNGIICS
jgi:hypothetical protein